MPTNTDNEIVYGTNWEIFVLLPREDAIRLAVLRNGLASARTWGDLKLSLQDHPGLFEEVLDELRWANEDDFEEPKQDQDFDAEDIPGYGDSDWPTSPLQSMMEWVPADVQQSYGRIASNMVSGDWLELDPSHAAEIVAALQALGYTCTQEEELVAGCFG